MLVFLSAKPYCLIGTVYIGCADYIKSPPAWRRDGGSLVTARATAGVSPFRDARREANSYGELYKDTLLMTSSSNG